MAPTHSIHIDHARKLVDVRMAGFYTAEDLSWAGEDVRAAINTLGDDAGQHVTLYDVSDVQVAPQATVEALKETLANPVVRRMWARKVAYVTPSALGRLQLLRLREVRPDIEVFEDRETALAWLLAE